MLMNLLLNFIGEILCLKKFQARSILILEFSFFRLFFFEENFHLGFGEFLRKSGWNRGAPWYFFPCNFFINCAIVLHEIVGPGLPFLHRNRRQSWSKTFFFLNRHNYLRICIKEVYKLDRYLEDHRRFYMTIIQNWIKFKKKIRQRHWMFYGEFFLYFFLFRHFQSIFNCSIRAITRTIWPIRPYCINRKFAENWYWG